MQARRDRIVLSRQNTYFEVNIMSICDLIVFLGCLGVRPHVGKPETSENIHDSHHVLMPRSAQKPAIYVLRSFFFKLSVLRLVVRYDGIRSSLECFDVSKSRQ